MDWLIALNNNHNNYVWVLTMWQHCVLLQRLFNYLKILWSILSHSPWGHEELDSTEHTCTRALNIVPRWKSFSFRILKEPLPCLSDSKFEKANAILLLETSDNPTFYLWKLLESSLFPITFRWVSWKLRVRQEFECMWLIEGFISGDGTWGKRAKDVVLAGS